MNKRHLIVFSVLLLSAVTSFWMLPSMSLRSHECFVSVTAREMLQNHDYAWPTLNGVPRLQKTPLSYWLVAGVAKLTGSVDEFSARLPSALFAFLSAAAILYYLNRWLSLRIAAISTAVWATSLAYLRCSHRARPDMVMVFFVILCMLSFYSVVISENRRQQIIQALIFWLSFAMANLAKGPAPIVYVSLPIAVYIIFNKKWNIITRILPFWGSLIFLVIILPWPLFIANKLNWDLILWKHEFIDRFFGDYAPGGYPVYYYLPIMFKYIVPWIVFLPIALFTPFYKIWETKRPLMTYMWIWFVVDFIFLTIDAGKRQHYILPLIPPASILIGIVLDDMFFSKKVYSSVFTKKILIIHVAVLTLSALIAPVAMVFIAPSFVSRFVVISVVVLIGVSIFLMFLKKNNQFPACDTVFASIVIFVMAASLCFYNSADIDKYTKSLAEKIASIVPPSGRLAAYIEVSSRFIQYYDGKVIPVASDISQLRKYYNQGYWIFCRSDRVEEIKKQNFRIIYSRELSEKKNKHKSDAGGILINKSAPIEKFEYANNTNSAD